MFCVFRFKIFVACLNGHTLDPMGDDSWTLVFLFLHQFLTITFIMLERRYCVMTFPNLPWPRKMAWILGLAHQGSNHQGTNRLLTHDTSLSIWFFNSNNRCRLRLLFEELNNLIHTCNIDGAICAGREKQQAITCNNSTENTFSFNRKQHIPYLQSESFFQQGIARPHYPPYQDDQSDDDEVDLKYARLTFWCFLATTQQKQSKQQKNNKLT